MKKINGICKERSVCDVKEVIDNTALIISPDGRSGLYNIKTSELVGSIGNYTNYSSFDDHYFFQEEERTIEEETTIRRKYNADDKRKYLRFYDTKNEKMVFNLWRLIWRDYNHDVCVIQNPSTNKYHIFERNIYMNSKSNFDMEFDYVELLCSRHGYFVFLVMKEGKKGLYSSSSMKNGLIADIKHDNIEKKNDIIHLTKGEDMYYIFDYCHPVISSSYEEITEDENMQNIVYAKSGRDMYVFMYNNLLFKGNYSKVEYIKTIEKRNDYREFIFKVTLDNKVGIISSKYDGSRNKNIVTTLVECSYDRIENIGYNYFLYNGDKVGLYKKGDYSIYDYSSYIVHPIYDKIEELSNDYYAFYTGECSNIAKIYNHNNHEVSNCLIVDRYDYDGIVVYIKDGKYGIFASDKHGNVYKSFGYDNIVNKTGGYFELERNGLKGMWFYHKVIIEPEYDSIQINGEYKYYWQDNKDLSNTDSVYLGLERNRVFTLARCFNYRCNNINVEYNSDTKYDDMLFLQDIMVLRKNKSIFPFGKKETFIYNYKNKLLKTFDSDVKVSYVQSKKCYNPSYLVDDTYYIYRNENFEEVCASNCTLYVTAYESEYATIVVNSYDKDIHDKKCNVIEGLTNKEVNDKILGYATEDKNILSNYPKLVRKR